jgi:hypothetical protein
MSAHVDSRQVEEALDHAQLKWLLDYWGPDKPARLDQTAQDLSEFIQKYATRFGERPDPFKLLSENPIKGRAFFQFDTLIASPEMKIMVWRILQGCEIAKLDFHYDKNDQLSLKITLSTPCGTTEEYHSDYWADFRVLRHLGTPKTNDKLRLEGYYAPKP